MSDGMDLTHEVLEALHGAGGVHRGPLERTRRTARSHARGAILLAAIAWGLGGCGSPSPPSLFPDGGSSGGGPGRPPPQCRTPQPSPTAGKACGCNADCDLGEVCGDEARTGQPGGSCLRGCAGTAPCPDGDACVALVPDDPSTQACLPRCETSAACRQGYLCTHYLVRTAGGFVDDNVCLPHCSSGADCPTTGVCDPYYGLCGLQQHPGSGDVGAACGKDEDCMSGSCAFGAEFPGGYCTAGCSLLTPDCPMAGECAPDSLGGDIGRCLESCGQDADCRSGYHCIPGADQGTSVCATSVASLTVSTTGAGSGTVSGEGISCGTVCVETASLGHLVTLTAVAASGSILTGWSGCDLTKNAVCIISLGADRTVVAFFEPIAGPSTLTVTRTGSGSGTVTGNGITCGSDCSEILASGASVVLTAVAASGATFTAWTGCDAADGPQCTISMTTNRTVTAIFDGHCTPDATRCVAGDIAMQERCSADGTWGQDSCGAWQRCAAGACHAACGMTSAPVDPTLCVLPIADGVNDGEWPVASDPDISSPDNATLRTVTRLEGRAEIVPAPDEDWPFMWRLRASDDIISTFRLDQFGPYRHPGLGYRAREAGVQPSADDGFKILILNPPDIVRSCISLPTTMWTVGTCSAETPYNQSLDYTGGADGMQLTNGIGLGIEKHEGVIDLLDVNYAYLTIAP